MLYYTTFKKLSSEQSIIQGGKLLFKTVILKFVKKALVHQGFQGLKI